MTDLAGAAKTLTGGAADGLRLDQPVVALGRLCQLYRERLKVAILMVGTILGIESHLEGGLVIVADCQQDLGVGRLSGDPLG